MVNFLSFVAGIDGYESKFEFLFQQLNVTKTRELVDRSVKPPRVLLSKPSG